ncbi:hypothetical protein GCM10027073_57070 [Streptomyces chlorus]|uniref:Helix-turn-helix transcriptional regulator n=1 Tax=Streptomyces chlorus TaxID=887452 RepID=A0ABW1E8R5_9ACTN
MRGRSHNHRPHHCLPAREAARAGPDGPAARRAPGSSAGLTAQELRVAQLAADRLISREVVAQLLISPRTVGHHLANVCSKLGITSRTELARIDLSGDLPLRVGADGG